MTRARRVTLRCIDEDLIKDWDDASDRRTVQELRHYLKQTPLDDVKDSSVANLLRRMPPLARVRHPLVQAFDDQFAGDDDDSLLRESISAVSDRLWLKQTFSSRWRGAAVVVRSDGAEVAWLGAAGYHREGSPEDFYAWFGRECAASSDRFMPAPEDEVAERVDRKITQLDAWKAQLHLTAAVMLVNSMNSGAAGPVSVTAPDRSDTTVLTVWMTVTTIEEEGSSLREVILEIHPASWEHARLQDVATRTLMAGIEPRAEGWRTAPLVGAAVSHAALLSVESERVARELVTRGALNAEMVPGQIRLGTVAHYARASQLTSATVEGQPVQALCGYWFVPMHDHEGLQACPTCASAHEGLEG